MQTIPEVSPVTETFRDVENLIYHVCNQFMLKHGGDFDDHFGLAQVVFLDCYRSWKPGMAPFTSYLSMCVYRRLLETKNRDRRLGVTYSINETLPGSDREYEVEDRSSSDFNLGEFYEELTSDARQVLTLITDTPPDLAECVEKKGGKPRNLRSSIKDYLRGLGWTMARIGEAFEEIAASIG